MKIYMFNWNNILTDVAKELKKKGHEVVILDVITRDGETMFVDTKTRKQVIRSQEELDDVDVFVTWTEVGTWGQFVKDMQALHKKVVLVQHGRRGTSRIFPPFNEELLSDVICVWGQGDKDRLMSVGIHEDRIKITGTPVLRGLKRKKHEGINVVYSPDHWDVEVPENEIVAKKLRKVKGVTVTTKLLQGEHNTKLYDNPIVSNRNMPEHLDIVKEVLSTADVVVGISESTFELMAEHMDIPVIIADIWEPKACGGDDRYLTYKRIYSRGCHQVKPAWRIPRAVKRAIKHPEYLRKERAEIAIEDGGVDIKDPSQAIIDVILST